MKRNGFTLVELLVSVVVLCTIAAIALPMHAIKAKRTEQMQVKTQLMTIKDSQDKYRMKHGTYTTDTTKLVNWKSGTRKYRFCLEYADRSCFKAQAIGDVDGNDFYRDIWVIDQNGTLTQIRQR